MEGAVLVIDDELLIAMDIQLQLMQLGYRVLLAPTVDAALKIIDREQVQAAIVDWHLRDQTSALVLDVLSERGIPFALCSGSEAAELSRLYPSSPILSKPFSDQGLREALKRTISGG